MTLSEVFAAYWFVLPVVAIVAYLLGSISFAILVTRRFAGDDIRNYGSGNAGATNVLRSQGVVPALLTTAGDLAKSVGAVVFARRFATAIVQLRTPSEMLDVNPAVIAGYVAGLFCIVGHLYPLYFGFRGGKGVMTTLGMFLVLDWRVALICLGVFIVLVLLFRMVSLGSCIAVGVMPVMTWVFRAVVDGESAVTASFCVVMSALIAVIIIVKHAANIKRICMGTESKVSFHKKEE